MAIISWRTASDGSFYKRNHAHGLGSVRGFLRLAKFANHADEGLDASGKTSITAIN